MTVSKIARRALIGALAAFPFSPAEIERGRSYAFLLNHVIEVADGHELVRTTTIDLSSDRGGRPS